MPAEPGFRSRQEIEAKHWRGRRRARRPMPHGKSLLVTGVVVLVLVSAGMLAMRSLVVSISQGGDIEVSTTNSAQRAKANSKNPFAGTPAARYPEGEAGIVLPTAQPLGSWTAPQVQDVLERTKRTLVAARLDPAMVEQGDATEYLSTISEGARPTVAASLKTAEAPGYVSRLDPAFRLLAPVRVKGTMSVELGSKQELVVGADYVWIYPLAGAAAGTSKSPGSKLVVVHAVETYQWFAPKGIAKKDTGLRPGAGQFSTINMDCTLVNSGRLGLPSAAVANGAPVPDTKAYDPATPPEALPNTC
jgi:hypothetical protein